MENAVYTFELLLQAAMKDEPEKLATVMEKAKHRVLKVNIQYINHLKFEKDYIITISLWISD